MMKNCGLMVGFTSIEINTTCCWISSQEIKNTHAVAQAGPITPLYIYALVSQIAMRKVGKSLCAIYLHWPVTAGKFNWCGEGPVPYCLDLQAIALSTRVHELKLILD